MVLYYYSTTYNEKLWEKGVSFSKIQDFHFIVQSYTQRPASRSQESIVLRILRLQQASNIAHHACYYYYSSNSSSSINCRINCNCNCSRFPVI